ncbi:hypothetical protein OC842_005678 [Tilletia horrida]|uniref:Uncharacterized protein n=1 Tax=Tilletia horrida TaxID=155126 RepID=A0AAN6G7D2_9BASI|nr:hypothetical protein OC842_005678 [Tilletia horrida]
MPPIDLADPAFRNAAAAQWAAVQGGPTGGIIVHGNYNQPARSGPDEAFMTIFKKFNDLEVEHKHLQEEFNLLKKRYDTSKGRLKKLQTGETRASNKLLKDMDQTEEEHDEEMLEVKEQLIDCMNKLQLYENAATFGPERRIRANPQEDPFN